MKKIKLVLKGFCIGAADVVPGVSGGTMAFILGIYQPLVDAIRSFDKAWLKRMIAFNLRAAMREPHFSFLIPLGIGIFMALIFFTRIVPLPVLLKLYPEIVYGFFFGLISGSLLILLCRFSLLDMLRHGFFLVVGLLFGASIVMFVPVSTPDTSWFIFLCGTIASTAMILPGISGSFILLLLQKYDTIFNAIGHFDWSIIIPFLSGIIIGIILSSRILSYLLRRFYQQTILFICGLLIASLYIIWPFQNRIHEWAIDKERLIASVPYVPADITPEVTYSIVMIWAGIVIIMAIHHFSNKTVKPKN